MANERILLSNELLDVLRRAVNYAVEYDSEFVAPAHLMLGLLDVPKLGEALRGALERGRVIAAARQSQSSGLRALPEGVLPRGESAPFQRYDSLVFQSPDGSAQRWFNKDAYQIFHEAAEAAAEADGPYTARHLALGFVQRAKSDRDVKQLLGRTPDAFAAVLTG